MAQMLTDKDFADVKRDINDIGDSVNEKKIIQPRYGAPYRSIPLVVENIENTINEWDTAVNTITQEGGIPDLAVSTWSGRTQGDKNKELVSAQDFGAKGDGVTDDTQAFNDLEAAYAGRIVDMLGKTYLVNKVPTGNKYINGTFSVDGQLINPHSAIEVKPLIDEKNVKSFAKRYILSRTAATGGYNSVPQGACCDHKNGKIYQVAGGGTDGRGHSLNIFDAKTLGRLSTYVANRSTYFGHQGVGVSYAEDGSPVVWMGRNYDNTTGTGNKVVSFTDLKTVTADSIQTGIIEWKLFDDTSSSQSTSPAVSSCGRYLLARMYEGSKVKVRVFDIRAMWESRATTTDYSNKYISEFTYEIPVAGSAMQGLACDGSYIYVLEAVYGFSDNAWVYVFTLAGEFVYRINISNVGLQDAINDSPNPSSKDGVKEYEGLLIFSENGKQSLGVLLATSWPENGAAAKRAYIYEVGSVVSSAVTQRGLTTYSDDIENLHSSSGNQQYNFGVNDGFGGYFWSIHPERKGIMTNMGNPVFVSGGLYSGFQATSNGVEGLCNILLARTDAGTDESARLIFHKSRSGTVKYTDVTAIGSARLGRVVFNGDTATGHATGAEIVAQGVSNGDYIKGTINLEVGDGAGGKHFYAFKDNTVNLGAVPVYADNTAAKAGGLVNGDVYRTSIGQLMIVY